MYTRSEKTYQALFPSHKEHADKAIVCTGLSTPSVQVTITVSGVDVYVHTWQTLGDKNDITVFGERYRNTTCTAGCRYVALSLKILSSNACVRQLVTGRAVGATYFLC